MIDKIIGLLSIPLLILNLVGGITAGIWLAFLGEWKLIAIGIILFFISHHFLSLLLMLGFLFAPLVIWLYERKNPLVYLGFAE